jgi:hypothetical protein
MDEHKGSLLGAGFVISGFPPALISAILGHARAGPTAKDHFRRDAPIRRARDPDLLLRLSLLALRRDQRLQMGC